MYLDFPLLDIGINNLSAGSIGRVLNGLKTGWLLDLCCCLLVKEHHLAGGSFGGPAGICFLSSATLSL